MNEKDLFYSRLSEKEILRRLVKSRFDPKTVWVSNETPIYLSILRNHYMIFRWLLVHGAETYYMSIVNQRPMNLVDLCIYKERPKFLKDLYKKGLKSLRLKDTIQQCFLEARFLSKELLKIIVEYERVPPFYIKFTHTVPFDFYLRTRNVVSLDSGLIDSHRHTLLDYCVLFLGQEPEDLIKSASNYNIGDYVSQSFLEKLKKNRLLVEISTKGSFNCCVPNDISKIIISYIRPLLIKI